MYLILPIACTLFQSSKSIKFGHRPYSGYEKKHVPYYHALYSIVPYYKCSYILFDNCFKKCSKRVEFMRILFK